MFGLCVIAKYKVKITYKGSSRNECGEFIDYEEKEIKEMDGGKLLEEFARHFKAVDFWEFTTPSDKFIHFSWFNPFNGEGRDIDYEILDEKVY